MAIPKPVRITQVKRGDEIALTVSTVRIKRGCYDTVIFDDSADKRHSGMLLGGLVIDKQSQRAATREEAMEQHREALYETRTGTPRPLADGGAQ